MPVMTEDVTEIKITEAPVKGPGSQFMTDEFLSVLSHELRTPLTPILGWVSLLRQSGSQDPQIFDRALTAIERNAEHQKALVNDLMDVSLILSGRIQLDCHRRSLEALLRGLRQAVELQSVERSITIEMDIAADLPPVEVDGPRIHQALINIINNAIKFSPEGGVVSVKATYEGGSVPCQSCVDESGACCDETNSPGHIRLEIIDRGDGIPVELLPRIFDMFQQGDSSTTRRHGGLGLGLTISRGFIEMHGGTVSVTSPGAGQGTRFIVTLPAAPPYPTQ